jgi:serine protease
MQRIMSIFGTKDGRKEAILGQGKIFKHTLILLLLSSLFPLLINAQRPGDHVRGEVLIQFRHSINASLWDASNQHLRAHQPIFWLGECLSEPMNIWKLVFDTISVNENELLQKLRQDPAIASAQFNHYLELRSARPNDPDFVRQWYLNNTGQDGGTPGLDLGMLKAWDTTTGGVTPAGDTIVVCVIDDGIDTAHQDLRSNIWINRQEIPGNNRDDDENGYIDDAWGWNVRRRNDNISEDATHGTPVAGVIGAVGNNRRGVTGVNWRVKIMGVVGGLGTTTEDQFIQAYTYPFIQRRLYNRTGGKRGAFVVATNSSWGIKFARPADYPIWCSFFDSLGHQGILNVGATDNTLGKDVDAVGDMPSNCGSEHLIVVTSIDRTGILAQAHGKASVDLAAPAENIYLPAKGNTYRVDGGTSFATPQVAGAIALLYAAPCPTLASVARKDPAAASLLLRKIILQSTKPLPGLKDKVATGGYLHVLSAMQSLLNTCGACPPLLSVRATGIGLQQAFISWTGNDSIQRVDLRYRIKGTGAWTTLENTRSPFLLGNLQVCTQYEFQVKAFCRSSNIEYDEIFSFRTDGCCEPPSTLNIPSGIVSSTIIRWPAVSIATGYNFRYRPVGTNAWIAVSPPFTSINLRDLLPCTTYEAQIQSICIGGALSAFSTSYLFSTGNCGACLDLNYCRPGINPSQASDEWIKRVQIDKFNNASRQEGYGDFTALKGLSLARGKNYSGNIRLGLKSASGIPSEFIVIWADFNQSGDFTSNEVLYNSGFRRDTNFNLNLNIPMAAKLGLTRLRIALRYNSEPSACVFPQGAFGEMEDYCLNIEETNGLRPDPIPNVALIIWPNPSSQDFEAQISNAENSAALKMEVFNAQGQRVFSRQLSLSTRQTQNENIPAQNWPKGIYVLRLWSDKGEVLARKLIKED